MHTQESLSPQKQKIQQRLKEDEKDRILGRFSKVAIWLSIIVFVACVFIFSHLPKIFTSSAAYTAYCETGQIGDTIGGIMGPPIALLGAALTFLAFWIQYNANRLQQIQFKLSFRQQEDQIEKQRQDWEIERFESRFYDLIKDHKENVAELELGQLKGKTCFPALCAEFDQIYVTVTSALGALVEADSGFDNGPVTQVRQELLAYNIFFFGVGREHSYAMDFTAQEKEVYKNVQVTLSGFQEAYNKTLKMKPETKRVFREDWRYDFQYLPYNGHSELLGNYYRQLHQTVSYVNARQFLDQKQKYEYFRALRSHLTGFEQLLLFYNGSNLYPEKWKPYLTEFRIIKNVPFQPVVGPKPSQLYQQEMKAMWDNRQIKMFEDQVYPANAWHFKQELFRR